MNCKELKKILKRRGITVKELSKKTGICKLILYCKISGCIEFRATEIVGISKALFLTNKQIKKIFFS